MGNRLTKIYTRTGDNGETGLGDGSRISKDSDRIQALGSLDELNSWIGLLLTKTLAENLRKPLTLVQHRLFDLGGELSIPDYHIIDDSHIEQLESFLDHLNETLPPLKDFILPGGCEASAVCHLARTVCRRAERDLVKLMQTEKINTASAKYLNRLSDLLFVMARYINAQAGSPDVLWQKNVQA
ncbi:MAG: cob(I)yrinic acid a,c-diamide adenosyltransferase [Gammaproteobacteria bacterium]